ncbi:hypothetical protein M3Y99_01704800 [Aphelenchoides fujianensis]|nr:hypothetical protein M3Y99_01704800 [Aphelenchoides fujianensis]
MFSVVQKEGLDGLLLLTCSILLGFLVERAFERVRAFVVDWRTLLSLLATLCVLNGFLVFFLWKSALHLDPPPRKALTYAGFVAEVETLWETREQPTAFDPTEAFRINQEALDFIQHVGPCTNVTHALPSSHKVSNLSEGYVCHLQISAKKCVQFSSELIAALRGWNTRIDVILTLFAFDSRAEQPLSGVQRSDPMFSSLKSFYSNLSSIAREMVVVSGVNLFFQWQPMKTVQLLLHEGQRVERLGDPLAKQLDRY